MAACFTCYLRDECPDMGGQICDHYRDDNSDTAARHWLRNNRCPKCRKRKQPACPYKIEKTLTGVKCSGYRFYTGKEKA